MAAHPKPRSPADPDLDPAAGVTSGTSPLPGTPGRSPAVALGALAVWLLATLGVRPLAVPDEGRYAEVARRMWVSGDWLVPRLGGLPFFHKPPLMYWLDAAGYALFGPGVFAARLAPAVGGWLLGASLFCALRRWQTPARADTALWVLATAPLYFLSAQYANHDMLVAGTISACVVAAVRAVDPSGPRSLRWLVIAWACAGLAMLSKGLIGIVLPALVLAPWLAWQRRWGDLRWCLHPLGVAAFALVALPWCVVMQRRYPGFYDYFIVEQHFRRYAESGFNNAHGPWYYPVLLPLATLPWSLWLWRRPAAWPPGRLARCGWCRAQPPFAALCAWWLVVVVGFFSLPQSKLIGYVLPALLPWAWWLSRQVERAPRRAVRLALAAALLLDLGTVAALRRHPVRSTADVAAVLAAHIGVDDRVVFVDDPFYDLPFAAQLRRLPIVASDWADPTLPLHDNWRKELADAARFDPAQGRALLRPLDQLQALACGGTGTATTWFVARPHNAALVRRQVAGVVLAATGTDALLFSVPQQACR